MLVLFITFLILLVGCSSAKDLIIFTVLGSNDDNLRELIGSIHNHSDGIKVKVFGYPNNSGIIDEITLWKRVQFLDISRELKFKHAGGSEEDCLDFDEYAKYCMFEYLFEEEGSSRIIYIENGSLFKKELLAFEDGIGEGYEIHRRSARTVQNILKSYRNGVDPKIKLKFNGFRLPKVDETSNWFCSIKVRRELIYSSLYPNGIVSKNDSNIVRVALLVPTKNPKSGDVGESALMKYLIKSIEEGPKEGFLIKLYVGYDWDDVILSRFESRAFVANELKKKGILSEFVEFPRTNWLTFIWNNLFVRAYADGHDYFVQLNDDITFENGNWLDSSIEMMKIKHLQVVGFNDSLWKCKLYTQSLVSRRHYINFEGQYFPLSLANWYSDNWISSIYGEKGKCNYEAKITNGHILTRYKKCSLN